MPNKTHIAYLDTIRGLAALTVINSHFVIAYGLPCKDTLCIQILDNSPLHFWWDGEAAVSMFFVLSGFVLSLKYFLTEPTQSMDTFGLLPFIIRRLFRIWLPYSVILLISCFLYRHILETPIINTLIKPSIWIVDMWRNSSLSILDMFHESFLLKLPANNVLLPQAWTLTIELVLSLLLPIGLILLERSALWLIFFSLLCVSFLDTSIFLLHFLAGLMMARHHQKIVNYLLIRSWTRRCILLIGLFFYTTVNLWPKTIEANCILLSEGIGASLIIIYALSSKRTQRLLSNTYCRLIGKVSYSAYLIHLAIFICLTPFAFKTLEAFTITPIYLWLSGWLITVVVVQILSWVSYYVIESPSMYLGQVVCKQLKFIKQIQ